MTMAKPDPTAPERMARYRQRLKQRGGIRVNVWAFSREDADEIHRVAAELRERHQNPDNNFETEV
jgi:hypothetical protein